jgi:UDPglucose 6-dehydrogenase
MRPPYVRTVMKIAMIGLGKLGLPVLLTIESKGHEVMGCEISTEVRKNILARYYPNHEPGVQELLKESKLWLGTISEAVEFADIIFVAVQTPHEPQYEGTTPLPETRADFDYSFLKEAVSHVADAAERQRKDTVLVIISTVLPGTIRREVMPLLNKYIELAYNPSFIAMGETVRNFRRPEFNLIGTESVALDLLLRKFYHTIHHEPVIVMGIEEAELTKVAYNTFVTSKIVFANTLMEVCEGIGADVDMVTDALGHATDRVVSPKYLRGGMGDGGGCHPRDNIALSWLARKLSLSHDLFGSLMEARERQTRWLADIVKEEAKKAKLPIVILGKAFKAETNIMVGSPAFLLANFLGWPAMYDPYVDGAIGPELVGPCVFVVGTNHPEFQFFPYPPGSVVIDPWGYVSDQPGVRVRRIGRTR